jgi:hypothetical protein
MPKTNDVGDRSTLSAFHNPVLRFEGSSDGSAEAIYDLLSDLTTHLSWAGAQQSETTRLLTLDAPAGRARVGTESLRRDRTANRHGGRIDRSSRRPLGHKCSNS